MLHTPPKCLRTPEAAFRSTGFAPASPEENIRRGPAAADLALERALKGGRGVAVRAMYRADVGPNAFYWGETEDALREYKGGSGLSQRRRLT